MDDRPAVPLAQVAVDRASERREDTAWLAARWADPATRVLHVRDGRVETAGEPPALVLVPPYPTADVRVLLGVDTGDVAYFAVLGERPGAPTVEDADAWRGLRELGAGLSDLDAGLLVQALGLANWHESHPRCPRCGAPTEVVSAGYARRCPADGSEHHPRTDPAVIMLVVDDEERALLGRHARWSMPLFSTLAGFVEPGESAESAVAREVREESGIVVDRVEFAASQPWPFPSSLMIGFHAHAAGGEPAADGVEVAEVRWFSRTELAEEFSSGAVLLPPRLSIARRLIESWYGQELVGPVG